MYRLTATEEPVVVATCVTTATLVGFEEPLALLLSQCAGLAWGGVPRSVEYEVRRSVLPEIAYLSHAIPQHMATSSEIA